MLIFPEVSVFEHTNFDGYEIRTNVGFSSLGDWWNDRISSVIIISGTWEFFEHQNFRGASVRHGPGYYSFVENPAFNMANDSISSFRVASWWPQGDAPVFG